MLKKITRIPKLLGRGMYRSENEILENLSQSLAREAKTRLSELSRWTDAVPVTGALHLAIENLTNAGVAIEKTIRQKKPIDAEAAMILLGELIKQTKAILETVTHSSQANEINLRTLNMLFCAKQAFKQREIIVTPISLPGIGNPVAGTASRGALELTPTAEPERLESATRLVISSTHLYQMRHSLFPAEKMLIGAARRDGDAAIVEGIFEVTGEANSGHVKANATRLGGALISMSETGTYFGLWIHSHPGSGAGMTHPSQIDHNQEADWLRDYSPDLVSAIMVRDGFVRFWGKALDHKRVTVTITGAGVKRISANEYIYRLEG